jgi:hypothetical protein
VILINDEKFDALTEDEQKELEFLAKLAERKHAVASDERIQEIAAAVAVLKEQLNALAVQYHFSILEVVMLCGAFDTLCLLEARKRMESLGAFDSLRESVRTDKLIKKIMRTGEYGNA